MRTTPTLLTALTALLAYQLAPVAFAQSGEIKLHQANAGKLEFLEPDGWQSKLGTGPNGVDTLTMAPAGAKNYSLIISTNLVASRTNPQQELDSMTARTGTQDRSILWQNEHTAAAKLSFRSRTGHALHATAVCTQTPEGKAYRHSCGMGISASAEIARTILPAKRMHSLVQSIRGMIANSPPPSPAPAQVQSPAPAQSLNLIGAWSTSGSSPSFTRFLQNGGFDIGGSGETIYLELGPKNTYRFVDMFRTTGPYFPGISITDDRGKFTVENGVLTFDHSKCKYIVQSADNPITRESCAKDGGLNTLEITSNDGGQTITIKGVNLTFMGRGQETKTLRRVR